MPPKKQIQLQIAVENQEEWKDFISKDGVAVMDVYSAWCGPCKAVTGLFRRVKNEIGDDLLRFGLAKADAIEELELYRDNSLPTFLFYSKGTLVAVVRGAMGPLLERTIKEKLAHEHKVLNGEAERVQVVDEDLGMAEPESEEEPEEEETTVEPRYKQCTVMMIKPDAVREGKVEEIVEALKSHGLEILAQEEHKFNRENAEEFYQQHKDEEFFEELIEFICSGPCVALVLTKGDTGEGVMEEIRELVGPKDVEVAKEEAPESIRATYGTDTRKNAVHASDSYEVAARELAFFMPKFKLPYVPGTEPPIQRTLALIRPDALAMHKEAILEKMKEAGFKVAYQKELTLTKEQAEEFYKEHKEKEFFDSLTTHMSGGPVLALCLARKDAVSEWRKLLGSSEAETLDEEPKKEQEVELSFRKQFSVEGGKVNPLHGSDSIKTAEEELSYFFPMEHTVGIIKPSAMSNKEEIIAKIEESGFKISMANEMNLTKEVTGQLYNQLENKEYFEDLTNVMSTGPCMVMVLSRPDAVQGWRSLIGPVDPEEAKLQNPDCLRALYGNSVMENAVHGSSNTEHAVKEMEQLIGPVKILPDGSIQKDDGAEGNDGEQEPANVEQQGTEEGGEQQATATEEAKTDQEAS